MPVFIAGFYVMVIELSLGRLMAPFFGQSAYTWTAITAATLLGLAVGNTLGGRFSHWRRSGLHGACAGLLLSGLWCMAMPLFSGWLGRWLASEVVWGWTVRIGLYSVFLLIPAMIFLGMVSPGIAYMFVRQVDTGRSVGTLYFWGMTGSLAGSLVTGLWLPFEFPVTDIIFYGGASLLFMGGLFLATSRVSLSGKASESYTEEEQGGFCGIPVRMGFVVFLVATACMGAQMSAIRLITPVTGASYVVWSVSFGIFIFGMAVGGWFGGRISDLWDKRPFLYYWLLVTALIVLLTPHLIKLASQTIWVSGWSWMPSLLGTILISFLPLSVALGLLSTVAIRTALKDEKSGEIRRKGIGWCYGLASGGNVVGTLIAGYLLVGVIRMSAVLLLMSLVLLVCGLLLFREKRQVAALILAGTVVLYLMVFGKTFMDIRPIEAIALGDPIFDEESRYGRVSVYQAPGQPTRRTMMLDRVEHSTIDTSDPRNLYSLYTRVLACASDIHMKDRSSASVCIIGGGGYALPRYFRHSSPGRICVIEIDPVVTKAAVKACALDLATIESVNLDGRLAIADLLKKGVKRERFDVIIGDTVNDAAIPYHLVTREFNDGIKSLLREDGCYMLHILDTPDSGKLIASMLQTLKKSFASQAVIAVTGVQDVRQSHIILAANVAVPLDRIREELLRVYPEFEGKVYGQAEANTWASLDGAIVMSDAFAPIERLVLDSLLRSTGYQVTRLLGETKKTLDEKRYGDAAILAEKAFLKNPDNADVLKFIYVLYEHAQEENLFDLLEKSARRPSGGALAKHYYAQALMAKGKYREAATVWDSLAVRFVQLPEFLGYASRAHAAGGNLPEAYDRAKRQAEGAPSGGPERLWLDSLRRQMEAKREANPRGSNVQ